MVHALLAKPQPQCCKHKCSLNLIDGVRSVGGSTAGLVKAEQRAASKEMVCEKIT